MKRNLAARAGHWSATHRKTAIFGWLAFVIVAVVLGTAVGTQNQTDADLDIGESGRADAAMRAHFPDGEGESVLVQSKNLTADDAEFKAAIASVEQQMKKVDGVRDIESPLSGGGEVSKDKHSVLVEFEIAGDDEAAETKVDATLAATAAAQRAHPDLRIEQFGGASAEKALSASIEDDFKQAETLSLPITLLILVLAFGALVAASVPLVLALSAVGSTIGLVSLVSQISPVDESIASVILLIGLAVGVDYSMFYLRREREERAAGKSPSEALDIAAATSGRAVLISGLTVMIAMAGLFLTGFIVFESFAIGTILVVAIAMLGSLTVLPAVLAALGDRVEKGRVPFIGRRTQRAGDSRLWSAILDRVLRHPVVSTVIAGGLLVALTIPALGMKTADPSLDTFPKAQPVMQTYDRIPQAVPGSSQPAEGVVQADDVTAPNVQAGIEELRKQALATGLVHEPFNVEVSGDKKIAVATFALEGDGTGEESIRGVEVLRDSVVPATIDRVPGTTTDVSGEAANTKDFNDLLTSHAPYVFAFVLSFAFVLLLVTFRSLVVPIKAIVLNLLSVGAAYGVMVLVFQHGWGESVLGFESSGAITTWLPLFMFVVLFGLSMDYHVFILSRIREAYDRGMSTDEAVSHGIKSTAGVVTSAAIVMVAVFAIFATLSWLQFKQMGVGLSAAILIDATLVRGVLLPATMKLLGDWNWYLPKRLEWLPRFEHEGSPQPART
jgi:uncharacterized membrane protein YdfJ with MMPL/SSD domain